MSLKNAFITFAKGVGVVVASAAVATACAAAACQGEGRDDSADRKNTKDTRIVP